MGMISSSDISSVSRDSVIPSGSELSLSEAARVLDTSLTLLTRILDMGRIPYHEVDGHRRIFRDDLLSYKKSKEERELALDELAAESERLGLYDMDPDPDAS